MISKLAPILLAVNTVAATDYLTKGTGTWSSGYYSISCERCIIAGWKYCEANEYYSRVSSITDTNRCVAPTTACSSSYREIIADGGKNLGLEILKCA